MSNAILTSSQYQNYRRIDLIVIHCSATRATQRYTVDDCRRDHRARGFADIGYHYYITRDGVVHAGRPLYMEQDLEDCDNCIDCCGNYFWSTGL